MSRENEPANLSKQQSIREHNVGIFQNFKNKLVEANLQANPLKWVNVTHTFRNFVSDARIYYDEARPDIVDCVQIATNAVMSTLPVEVQRIRPVNRSHFPEPYRVAFDELQRLLVVVGSYQPEIANPHKGGDPRHDLFYRLQTCIAAFGIDPDSLLDKSHLEAAMLRVSLDDKSRQTIFTSHGRRRPDALSVVSSARSTPSLATPVLSVATPHTSASPQVVASVPPTIYSGPTPMPMHAAAPHLPLQMQAQHSAVSVVTPPMPSPTTPSTLASPIRQNATDHPKPRKQPKWMARDLDEFRKEKKMASSGGVVAAPLPQQPATAAAPNPVPATPVQPLAAPSSSHDRPNTASSLSTPTTLAGPNGAILQAVDRATEGNAKALGVTEVDGKSVDGMDVDTPPLDEPAHPDDLNKPVPYTLPSGPYPRVVPPTWCDIFAEAIRASHEHKLSIGDMLRYTSTVYPGLKGAKHAMGAVFNSKVARQTGKATVLQTTVVGDLRVSKQTRASRGPRFGRTSDVYPVTWALEDLEPTSSSSSLPEIIPQPLDHAEDVVAEEPSVTPVKAPVIISTEDPSATVNDASPDPVQDASMPDSAPSLPYTLRSGPYSSEQPSKALAVLIQEAILAGSPEKALSQPDVISYIRTVYPFYASSPNLESEVSELLRQHFAPKDDGRWSLWIRDGSEAERPLPFTLPPGPRSSAKPDRPLQDLIREAILASKMRCLTQRDVAAYVLSVAPYYNGADEPLPFGQLLREHFVQRGSDAEGRQLWAIKDDEGHVEEEPAAEGGDPTAVDGTKPLQPQTPVTPVVAQLEIKPPIGRPPKHKGPPKSAAIVESDHEQQSDPEMLDPITPSTASAAFPSPVVEAPPPLPVSSSSRPFTLPPGPYTSHKPPRSNEELVVEALLASSAQQLQKKEIAVYLQTVYPWFRRDERAIMSCKKMVEAQISRLNDKGKVTRLGKGVWKLKDSTADPIAPSSVAQGQHEVEDEDMDDVAQPSPPKTTRSEPSSGSTALTIRIPARTVSGGVSASVSHKRSAPSASPARSASPSHPKRVRLIVRPPSDAVSPSQAETSSHAAPKAKASPSPSTPSGLLKPKTNGIHASPVAVELEAVASPAEEQTADVEMRENPEVVRIVDLPPLPPVSFGEDACLVHVAFGRPSTASFELHVHPRSEQWTTLERWRNAARSDDDVSDALSYSLVCYRSEDVHSLRDSIADDAWGNTVARTEIPVSLHNQGLHSLYLTGNGRTVPFPLTWMAGTASPLFLDISAYLVAGDNTLTLAHTDDLSAFAFAIVAHRPNPHQLRWLDARREPWRRLQAQFSQSMQVPQLDYSALLLASRDVSKVDLERGLPQELLTLS